MKETVGNVAGTASASRPRLICVTGTGAPGPVSGVRFDADRRTVRWNAHPRAKSYDVVRGNLMSLRSSAGNFLVPAPVCVENEGTDLQADLSMTPTPGQALYILVRATECNGALGTWNDAGTTTRDTLNALCP